MNKPKTCEHGPAHAASAAGNYAALREALEQAKVAILAAKEKMGVTNPVILEIIDAALSAPPRNCDKYENLHVAWLAWQAYCSEHMNDAARRKFHVWLYDTAKESEAGKEGGAATEQEGGAK